MLHQLTDYLLRFHRISIPGLGTIELVQQPATLDIVNKLIYPPFYKAVFSTRQDPDPHQLEYLQSVLGEDPVQQKLQAAGAELNRLIRQQPFLWNGIGTFEYAAAGQLKFRPEEMVNPLQPVPANKVLREHVQHSVLVGDQVVLSDGTSEQYISAKKARDLTITIGWVVALLAIVYIVYFLYERQFTTNAPGLSTGIEQKAAPPGYK